MDFRDIQSIASTEEALLTFRAFMLTSSNDLDLLSRVTKRDRDLLNSNNHVQALEDEIRTMSTKMSKLENERQKAQEELKDVLPELEGLRKKLADLKRVLDEEQLKKADLENTCARLEEDLKFKLQLLEKELTEVRPNEVQDRVRFPDLIFCVFLGKAPQGDRDQRDGRQAPGGVRGPTAEGPRGAEGGVRQANATEQGRLLQALRREGK